MSYTKSHHVFIFDSVVSPTPRPPGRCVGFRTKRKQLAILLTLIGGVTETDPRGMRRRGTPHLLVVGEKALLLNARVIEIGGTVFSNTSTVPYLIAKVILL